MYSWIVMYQSELIPKLPMSPPRKTSGHLTCWKSFAQIPRYVDSLDGQMPHWLVLQKASNPPPTGDDSKIHPCVKPFIQNMLISY